MWPRPSRSSGWHGPRSVLTSRASTGPPRTCLCSHIPCKNRIHHWLLATNSDSTFEYATKLGVGMIATNMIQPTPLLAKRMAEFQASKIPNQLGQHQPAHVAISFFVAETKEKAHSIARENWRVSDILREAPGQAASVVGATRPEFSTGAGSWATWDFEEAEKHCIYDDPAGCVKRLGELQEALPHMEQCILEFNRRGRIPSELVMESMRLFTDKVKPELSAVGAAS